MRRTLAVLVTTAALLVPATAASAASTSNASCNNGKGGNGATWNGHGGSYDKKLVPGTASDCGGTVTPPGDPELPPLT